MDSIYFHDVKAIGLKPNSCNNGITIEITFHSKKPMMEIVTFQLGEDEKVRLLKHHEIAADERRPNLWGRLPIHADET